MKLFKVVYTSILMIIQSLVLNHIGYGLSSIEYWISICFLNGGTLDG